jgi:glutathione S-transferase
MDAGGLELLQFPYSHYNEKVRWALDHKRVLHVRTNYLPGPHAMTMLRLTRQTQVPVVRIGGEILHGSAHIIDALENRFPEHPLYPADPADRKKALDLQAWFDAEVGPKVRRGVFAALLEEPEYVCGMFSAGRTAFARAMYRSVFPLTRTIMKKSMGIAGPASIDEAHEGTRRGFELVAAEAGADGYLVGGQFTIADLTAASLLAPAVMPPSSPMALPEPKPQRLTSWLERWTNHTGAQWVLETYRHDRPPSAAADGRAS